MHTQASFVDLAHRLKALANPARLALLRAVRTPRALSEIRLHPVRKDGGMDPDRFVARQTVERHLRVLVDIGLVVAHDGPTGRIYRASPEGLFMLREDLNQVSQVFAGSAPVGGETVVLTPAPRPTAGRVAHFSLIKGAYEGKKFLLDRGHEWTIGRAEDADVNLEYDPFVSKDHARLVRRRGKYFLQNQGRNGTQVNWASLDEDQEVPLSSGTVVAVGRSMLVFSTG